MGHRRAREVALRSISHSSHCLHARNDFTQSSEEPISYALFRLTGAKGGPYSVSLPDGAARRRMRSELGAVRGHPRDVAGCPARSERRARERPPLRLWPELRR